MFNKLQLYFRLTRMDKPIGWLLLLWPTLWGLWVAGSGSPSPRIVLTFVVGVILMRGAGCIVNDYLDKDLDRYVARTKNRHLVTGEVSNLEAISLFVLFIVLAFGLVLTLNSFTLILALGGLGLTLTYPLFKRFTHFPQVYLGLVFAWGIPMAFAAQRNDVPGVAWALVLANVFWTIAYDTMYAMVDRPDDQRAGIKSTAIWVGRYDLFFNMGCQAVTLTVLALIGQALNFSARFYIGLLFAAATVIYQNRLCKNRDPRLYLRAFQNNSWFGAAIFFGIFMTYRFSS